MRFFAVAMLLIVAAVAAPVAQSRGVLTPHTESVLRGIKAVDKGQLAVSEEDGRFLRVLVATRGAKSVLEIGTYLGHSLLIMLAANPKLRVTTIDLDKTYAGPAVEVLKRHFPKAQIDFRHGHSLNVLPQITEAYDLFHIDGTHEPHQVAKEWKALLARRSSDLVKVVIDDVDADGIWTVVDQIKGGGRVVEEEVPNCRWRNAYYAMQIT